jgi:N-methylhydantoinase A
MVEKSGHRIAVDIGGTFTDVVMIDPNGQLIRNKVPSTPADPSDAFIAGIKQLGIPLSEVDLVSHGTTVATNAVLTGNGRV